MPLVVQYVTEKDFISKARAWADSPHLCERDRNVIRQHLSQGDDFFLKELFDHELSFGTGGIRAPMVGGSSGVNRFSVRRVTQAFCQALKEEFSGEISVCIGFDCRELSEMFAREVARVMAGNGIRARLFPHIVPTPLVSYAVRYFKSQGGVMITASHNPRHYNGYKAYWSDGRQLTWPHDERVEKYYGLLNPVSLPPFLRETPGKGIEVADFQEALALGMVTFIDKVCEDDYYEAVAKECLRPEFCKEKGRDFPLAFTPLHGVGGRPVLRVLRSIGFENVAIVEEQKDPDGAFPTLAIPNPELKEALEKLIELMEERHIPLALATDPDADRLAVVVFHGGQSIILSGNHIGAILLFYLLETKVERGEFKKGFLVIKSILTSPLLASIGESYGCQVESTLPGFKWICEKIGNSSNFILGAEESYGYLTHTYCRDKDGVSSCALMAEVALYYHSQGRTLVDVLEGIYERYGYFHEELLSIYYEGIDGRRKRERIMEYFRDSSHWNDFPWGGVVFHKDYLKAEPQSNIVELYFDEGTRLFIRPSGTEAKMKFCMMVEEKEGSLGEKRNSALKRIGKIKEFMIQVCEQV